MTIKPRLELDFDDEPLTLRICIECTGSGLEAFEVATGYNMLPCRWCTNGIMSNAQLLLWKCVKVKADYDK